MESINILIASAHRGINNALEAAVLDVCYNRVFAHFTRTASLNDLVRFGRSGNYGLLIVVAAHVQPTKRETASSLLTEVASSLQVIRAHASAPIMAIATSDAHHETLREASVNCVLRFPFERDQLRAEFRRILKLPEVNEEATGSRWSQANFLLRAFQRLKSA